MSSYKREGWTVLPDRLGGGPMGLGDPEDRKLRALERDVIVPRMVKQQADQRCKQQIKEFVECVRHNKWIFVFTCRQENKRMCECTHQWIINKELNEEVKEKYLNERSDYRRTGKSHFHYYQT